MTLTITAEAAATKQFGVYVSPGYGVAWDGQLKSVMSKLFTTRIASLPWIAPGWLAGVQDLQSNNPDDLVRIKPAMGSIHPNLDMPAWIIGSPDHTDVWQTIAQASDNAVTLFAKGQQDAGRATLEALIAKADFWDAAYKLDKAIVSAPGKAVDAITGGVLRALGMNWHLVALVGLGVLVWYNRKTIAQALGKRVARG